ncbi:protocadherin Fat 2-like isoform X2 [Xenia sp. Carnegie-2017]|uniref:protocadherin Fat 2-like isoform X2 n=1 Tax=Xenia sp. Carnegie-2017 TaxID=2897299 RepID=UPI001F0392D1|nr:protocadherin Fat 2-like isoform X2 [Xenia sp. Carnegie-2017]
MSGTEILYLKENSKLSVEWFTDEDLTISKRSSFSVYYLGTSGGILGFNSVSNAVKLEKLPSYSRHHYYYYYYDSNDNYNQFKVTGWITSLSKSPMVFQTRTRFPVEDLFIAPRNGIYMVTTKLHVQNDVVLEGTCHVKLQVSVDGDVLDFVHKKELNQSLTTLTITTSLELEKWQGVAVHFSYDRIYCQNITVLPGGVFSVIYLDSAKQEFTLWPNPGPHIVEFPAEATVYVREDKRTSLVKCRAVGDSENIKYQWKTGDDKILGESSTLDTTKIGHNSNYVKCVANMNGLLEESKFITVVSIDPTVQFTDTYSNRIYYLPEKNETHQTGYENVMEFGVKENKTSSYYWYWTRKIRCSITKGNMSTFFISRKYSYYSGGDGEFFTLRAKVEKLDREVHDKYVLEITCVNTEYTDAPSAVTNITIEILDYNDNVPVFEKKIYSKTISNNIKPGEEIVQVIANDDDIKENGKISYSLKLDSNSYIFTIDKHYGFISLKANEKLTQRSYRLTVIATDQGKPPRKAFVTVVLDVQEGPVTDNNYPVFYKHQYEARLYVGVPKDTYVTTVRAHDPNTFDDLQINYFMLPSGLENFKVNESNGEITTKRKLTERQYDFMVGAEYSKRSTHMENGFYNTTKVVVYANYLDTTTPRFTKLIYHGKMKEDKKVGAILNVRVKANYNNKNVQYSLSENEKMFEIDGTSGEITLAKPLDYEKRKLHFFTVTASSSDVNHVKKEGFSIVVVHVLDVNDNAPIFKSYPRKADVTLGQGYQEIGRVYATDEDDGKNGKVGYYLAHDYNGLFSINTTNGSLYFNGGQLLQVADSYLYTIVIARDEGNPYNESAVLIHVTLHNPTPPTTVEPHSNGSSGHNNTILIVSLVGGVVFLIALILGFVFRKRCTSNRQAATAMTYIHLPPDEEDEELLDVEGFMKQEITREG